MVLDKKISDAKTKKDFDFLDYVTSIEFVEIDDETGKVLQRFKYKPNEKTKLSIRPSEEG